LLLLMYLTRIVPLFANRFAALLRKLSQAELSLKGWF